VFYGTLRTSQNKQFRIVFSDGYGDSKKWMNGKVVLIEKDYLLWIKEFERICNGEVSGNGKTVLVHTINRDYSRTSPKEFIDLGSKLTVIERSGEETFTYEFGSNVEACEISPDGNLVLVATAMPDNSLYCFDPQQKRTSWKFKNHSKIGVVLGLELNGNEIDVFTGASMAAKEKEYTLKLDGILSQEYEDELQKLKKIKKLVPRERVEPILEMIKSNNRREVIGGLSELKLLVTTKGSLPYYPRIADTLRIYLQDEDLFYDIWKIILRMLKKKPEVLGPLIPDITSWFKNKSESHHITTFLSILGELGKVNPEWIKNEETFVKQKLRSKFWNERRFAAFAVGSIGSVEPSIVKDVIPLLIEYASDPERVKKELQELAPEDYYFAVNWMRVNPETWLRDACIDSLGMIGKRSPESVNAAIPLLEKLSKDAPSRYTMKKAISALDGISETQSYQI
jgi:hypothetical protein